MPRALNPRLVGIRGPVEGGVFGLSCADLSIGRDASNQLLIEDPSVAVLHCRILRQTGGEFAIKDLGAFGATVVNGLPVTERVLQHGDEICLGDCRFLFLQWDAEPQPGAGTGDALPSAQPERTDCQHRILGTSLKESALNAQPLCSLTTMLKIGSGIQFARGSDEIAQHLLECIFETVPAQHGSVLLFEGQSPEPSFASHRDQGRGPARTVRTYRAIVDRARSELAGILAIGVVPDLPAAAAETLSDLQPRSVLAAPIITSARTLGVICLDSRVPSMPFNEHDLEVVSSLGAILGLSLESARRLEWLETENLLLQEAAGLHHDMVGRSPAMHQVYQFVARVAPTDSTVLIRGESGTGKELVAHAIHRNSPRAAMPFLAINCAGLSEELIESELFGHEKGAFTGAFAQKRGKFELADRGTVFLDELGEMPLACQAKLLRVIQQREFERVGGTRQIRSDIRLLAATNRDLETAIERGAFRSDLYYRLNVVSLTIPPLRDRREDIPLLARHFVGTHAKRAKRRVAGISRRALACLEAHDWPGNVRDLENAIERAVVLGSTELILAEDLPETVLESVPLGAGIIGRYHEAIRNEKMRVIRTALDQAGGSFTEAAKLLGINPTYLHRLVRNLGLRGALSSSAST